jgi:hypothetical protein
MRLSGAPQYGRLLALAINIRLARDKHSRLLRTFVNYGCKKLYNPATRGQCYKSFLSVISVIYEFL